MNDNEVMIKIIEWMISETSNKEYHRKLQLIILGLKGKKSIEEENHPRFMSIIFFSKNIFPFEMKDYREMAKLL